MESLPSSLMQWHPHVPQTPRELSQVLGLGVTQRFRRQALSQSFKVYLHLVVMGQ
jgi:hypothetical protein